MRRLYELDAMRGVAALAVAIHHLSIQAGQHGYPLTASLAVDLFFAISGYVMARTYEARLRDGLSTVQFVRLRYRRLFLPLAIGTSLGMVWALGANRPSLNIAAAYGLALTFLPAFWLPRAFLFNTPSWSLFLEIIANALHGSIFARMTRRTLGGLLVAAAVLSLVLLANGLAQWREGVLPILSCLPRELTFYLAGILLFRSFGDAPFGRLNGQWAAGLGALSYPLYAIHVPVMHLAGMAGLNAIEAFAVALSAAVIVTLLLERKRLNRATDHPGMITDTATSRRRRVAVPDVVNVADHWGV